MKPLAIDLFCGLGGWTEGLLAEGYDVIGYDIEAHEYGDMRYPGKLVIQDVLTIHGSQFKDAALIVASPPCQEYSYMAMPWKLGKAKAAAIRADATGAKREKLNQLFDACFRIQREASEAAGHHIPMVVENVRGAQPWVGRAQWNFGSFYLWGDVPALMPIALKARKVPGFRFNGSGGSFQSASVAETGVKAPGMNWSDQTKRGQDFTRIAGKHAEAQKVPSEIGRRTDPGKGARFTSRDCGAEAAGIKHGGDCFNDPAWAGKQGGTKQPGIGGKRANGKGDAWFRDGAAKHGSKSTSRKMAGAMIAKIPLTLSRHIAATYRPRDDMGYGRTK